MVTEVWAKRGISIRKFNLRFIKHLLIYLACKQKRAQGIHK